MPDQQPFLPPGRVPAPEDLRRASFFSPIVKHCLILHGQGECTWEEALMTAVLALLDVNRNQHEALVKMYRENPTTFLAPKDQPQG